MCVCWVCVIYDDRVCMIINNSVAFCHFAPVAVCVLCVRRPTCYLHLCASGFPGFFCCFKFNMIFFFFAYHCSSTKDILLQWSFLSHCN